MIYCTAQHGLVALSFPAAGYLHEGSGIGSYADGLQAAWITVHLLGLVAGWVVRIHAGSRFEVLVQGSYFFCLMVVALATVIGQACCLEMWPLSAATLAAMIVMAVVDPRLDRPVAPGVER